MALALDHVFCFVDPEGRGVAEVERAGFVVSAEHSHQDQGTSARFCAFPEHYLEWIWLRSREQALANDLRLDRRADWRTTGACPFGLGLRGPVEPADRDAFLPYRPKYRKGNSPPLLVHRLAWTPGPLPMLFTFEGYEKFRLEDMPPRRQARFADGKLFAHPHRPVGIASVDVTVPADVPAAFARLAPNTTIRRGDAFALDLTLEAEPFDPIALFGLVTIRSDGSRRP